MRCSLLLACLLLPASLTAQSTVLENQQLNATGGAFLDSFGRVVSIWGNRVLVTAFADDDRGSATVFERSGSTWVEGQKLTADDASPGDRFGISAVLRGDTILMGAEQDDDGGIGTGSVYVFEDDGTTWRQVDKLQHGDPAEGDGFGYSLDADGDVLVVGASQKDAGDQDAGAAYVFRRIGGLWIEEQKLSSPTPTFLGFFGGSVAISGNVIVVGAGSEDEIANGSGVAYAYRYDGAVWQLEDTLTASDGGAEEYFGTDVAIDGDVIAVGAYRHDGAKGAVYAFRWNGSDWIEEQKLQPAGVSNDTWVGFSVAISGPRIVAGAPASPAGFGDGSAFQFHWNGAEWTEVHTWRASSPGSIGPFLPNLGFSVDISFRTVFSGAPWADGTSSNSGAAYWYEAQDLALSVVPTNPAPGEVADFRTYGGYDGEAMGVFLINIEGIPINAWLFFGSFDGNGQQVLPLPVIPELAGLEMTLISLGRWKPGVVGKSNILTMTFGT